MTKSKQRPGTDSFQQLGEALLDKESSAIAGLRSGLDWSSVQASVELLLGCDGLVHVTGAGTSSSLARRLAHVLTCSGLPSVYLDSAQAQHGYSALIQTADVVIAFSRGGETDEINHVLKIARSKGARTIAISEKQQSSMAALVDHLLLAYVTPEDDAGGVIPLASTLAHAAVGDILCNAILNEKGLSEQEFASHHPGGAVGKRLSGRMRSARSDRTPIEELKQIRGFILDMDGVLWHGEQPLPGVNAFFDFLTENKLRFVLATNNPSKRPSEFAEKARSFGLPVDADTIVTSSVATVHYLRKTYAKGTRIHVIGEKALKEQITEAGFKLADENVAAVVAALQRDMTYETIKHGTLLIRAGAQFIGTNADPAYPTEEGFVPGSGMMVTALAASSGQEPLVMGKPQGGIFDLAMEKLNLPAEQVASVGDRLDTDIAGGMRYGLKTVLLLTGIAQPEDLKASNTQPDWVFNDLPALIKVLGSPS
ncbi:MAG: HAD-IIA family hydrolase [Anaerolineales bacterium]|jgi:4-nitrophenyl phosphatase